MEASIQENFLEDQDTEFSEDRITAENFNQDFDELAEQAENDIESDTKSDAENEPEDTENIIQAHEEALQGLLECSNMEVSSDTVYYSVECDGYGRAIYRGPGDPKEIKESIDLGPKIEVSLDGKDAGGAITVFVGKQVLGDQIHYWFASRTYRPVNERSEMEHETDIDNEDLSLSENEQLAVDSEARESENTTEIATEKVLDKKTSWEELFASENMPVVATDTIEKSEFNAFFDLFPLQVGQLETDLKASSVPLGEAVSLWQTERHRDEPLVVRGEQSDALHDVTVLKTEADGTLTYEYREFKPSIPTTPERPAFTARAYEHSSHVAPLMPHKHTLERPQAPKEMPYEVLDLKTSMVTEPSADLVEATPGIVSPTHRERTAVRVSEKTENHLVSTTPLSFSSSEAIVPHPISIETPMVSPMRQPREIPLQAVAPTPEKILTFPTAEQAPLRGKPSLEATERSAPFKEVSQTEKPLVTIEFLKREFLSDEKINARVVSADQDSAPKINSAENNPQDNEVEAARELMLHNMETAQPAKIVAPAEQQSLEQPPDNELAMIGSESTPSSEDIVVPTMNETQNTPQDKNVISQAVEKITPQINWMSSPVAPTSMSLSATAAEPLSPILTVLPENSTHPQTFLREELSPPSRTSSEVQTLSMERTHTLLKTPRTFSNKAESTLIVADKGSPLPARTTVSELGTVTTPTRTVKESDQPKKSLVTIEFLTEQVPVITSRAAPGTTNQEMIMAPVHSAVPGPVPQDDASEENTITSLPAAPQYARAA